MITEYDYKDDLFDIEFNGDLCAMCVHEPNCVMLKMIQTGALTINNPEPIIHCVFYIPRTPANMQYLKMVS